MINVFFDLAFKSLSIPLLLPTSNAYEATPSAAPADIPSILTNYSSPVTHFAAFFISCFNNPVISSCISSPPQTLQLSQEEVHNGEKHLIHLMYIY
jgi:hypothetical protein